MNALQHKMAWPVLALAGLLALQGCATQQQVAEEPPPPPPPAAKPAPMMMSGCKMAFPTGDIETSAVLVEKMLPAEAIVGVPFEYSIKVTNLTSNSLEGVTCSDQLPATFKVVSSTPQAESGGGGATRWSLGTLGPKESKLIKVSGTATAAGTIQTCATVNYMTSLCCSFPVVSPALKLVKTAPEEVTLCDNIPIKLVVTNTGTGSARGVRISDALASGLKSVDGKSALEFDAGTLGPGQSKEFSAVLKADKTGRFENKATAIAEGGLQASSGTTATMVRQAVLAIEKVCPDKLFAGRPITYTVTVTNNGDAPATNTVVEDTLFSGTTFVSASDSGAQSGASVVWNLGTLAPKASKKVTLTVNPGSMGIVKNTATARATCAQSVTDTCETKVEGIPAVLLEVIDIEDPDEVGTTDVYVITVTNQGSAVDTNIKIVAKLEESMEFVSTEGPTQSTLQGRNTVVFAPLPSLAPKAQAVWRLTVRALKPGDWRFGVEMNTDQLDRPVMETEATRFYE